MNASGIFYIPWDFPAVSAYVLCFFLKKLSKPTSLFGLARLLGATEVFGLLRFLAILFAAVGLVLVTEHLFFL